MEDASAADPNLRSPIATRSSRLRAPFMTHAMWFVWLLRSDIRGDTVPSDIQGQRDFTSWWLLWARDEYPSIFAWDREQATIAMDLIPLPNGLLCPRLLVRLYAARADLQQAFPLRDAEDLADYFCWYRVHGPKELAAAPQLPKGCLAITEAASKRLPWCSGGTSVSRISIALASSNSHLISGDINEPETRRQLTQWYIKNGQSLIPRPASPVPPRRPRISKALLRKDGVNLIGFVGAPTGLGEDLRMMSAALSAANVPHVLIDSTRAPQPPSPMALGCTSSVSRPIFATSIYCMSAFDMASLHVARGSAFFAGQYRIGYWPWELARFPDVWTDVYDLVDEIWTGSHFTAAAYKSNCTKPVSCLPAPVVVPAVEACTPQDSASDPFKFTYPFDPNSYLERKNPLALVLAFLQAFPKNDRGVALLLRSNGALVEGPYREAMLRGIEADERIVLVEQRFERYKALRLTASCGCLVSPHRAEGFGRNIAEAILLGIRVLATAFSGCQDYLLQEEGLEFNLRTVGKGQYPFGEGLRWADPIVDDIATKMQLVRSAAGNRKSRQELKHLRRRAKQLNERYAPNVAGRRIAQRLVSQRLIRPGH